MNVFTALYGRMTLQILEQIPDLTLVSGVGNYASHTACVMSAAVAEWRLRNGESLGAATDELDCVDPVVRSLCISINDGRWNSGADRTEWGLSIIPRILDTNQGWELTERRMRHCVLTAVRVYAADAMDRIGLADQASLLRGLPDNATYDELRADAAGAAGAAYAAARAADAAADAAAGAAAGAAYRAAARAAYAAADAAADAAARAADRAAYAAADDADAVRSEKIKLLEQVIEIGSQERTEE